MEYTNYYKVLQVDVEAESEVVKAAYRALSRKYHPDGTHPSVERMKRLNDAYAVLSDPQSRARYNDEVERRGGDPGGMAAPPIVVPPLRYHDEKDDAPKPRRTFRRNHFGVATQVVLGSLCLIGLVISGALRPLTQAANTPTPTPPVYQQDAETLKTAFEEDGFVFDTEITQGGEPLQHGADEASRVTVYISELGGVIQYASLLLLADEDLDANDLAVQEQAQDRLLDATLISEPGRTNVREWIMERRARAEVSDEITVAGWLIRMWSAPEQRTGIVIKPDIR